MGIPSNTWRGTCGVLALSSILLTSCGGGSSSAPPPAFNATGYWQTWLTDPVSGDETGPLGSYLVQNGAAVNGVAVSGTVAGSALNIDVALPGLLALLQFNGTYSGQTVTGVYTMVGFPLSETFRMEPFGPTGFAAANGFVNNIMVDFTTNTAFGERKYADQALTVLTQVNVVHDDGMIRFELNFDPATLAVGVLDASVDPVMVYAGNDNNEATVLAIGGTVTINQYDASGFGAIFALNLPASESIGGNFIVVYDLEAYDPP